MRKVDVLPATVCSSTKQEVDVDIPQRHSNYTTESARAQDPTALRAGLCSGRLLQHVIAIWIPASAKMTSRWLGVVTPAKAGVHVLQTLPSDFVAPLLWILSAIICFSSAASWACPAMDKARSGTQNDGLPHELRSLFSGGPGLDHGQFAPIGTPLCHRGFR